METWWSGVCRLLRREGQRTCRYTQNRTPRLSPVVMDKVCLSACVTRPDSFRLYTGVMLELDLRKSGACVCACVNVRALRRGGVPGRERGRTRACVHPTHPTPHTSTRVFSILDRTRERSAVDAGNVKPYGTSQACRNLYRRASRWGGERERERRTINYARTGRRRHQKWL